jgi:hypothetical protein
MSDKVKYILLGSIAVIVAVVCFILCIHLPNSTIRKVVLVNDVMEDSDRLIVNKSEGLKGAEIKKFTYKPEVPEEYKTPEEAIPEEPVEVLPNDKGIVSVKIEARDAEPLELVDPVKVFHKSSQDEKKVRPKANVSTKDVSDLIEELTIAEENRNKDRIKIREGIVLYSTFAVNEGELDTVTKKGAIIFPFEISNGKQRFEYLAQFKDIYERYNEDINFIFLNTSIEMSDSVSEIKEMFELYNISTDYPLYYDNYKNMYSALSGFNNTKGYVLLNNDGYICYMSEISEGINGLENRINNLKTEVKNIKEEDERIIRSYCDRKGMNFSEIIKLKLGVNLDY